MIIAPMAVNLLGFKVNLMDRGAIQSIGPAQQIDMFISTKFIQGYGEQNGDLSQVYLPLNVVLDQDVLDSNSAKGSVV